MNSQNRAEWPGKANPDVSIHGRSEDRPQQDDTQIPSRPWPERCDPERPTDAAPGSAHKVQVMHERARLRLPLFHPDDDVRCAPDAVRAGRTPSQLPSGVTWDARRGKYRARSPRPQRKHLGMFATVVQAALALADFARENIARAQPTT